MKINMKRRKATAPSIIQTQKNQLENNKIIEEPGYTSITQYPNNQVQPLIRKSEQLNPKETISFNSLNHETNQYENKPINSISQSIPIPMNHQINDKIRLIHTQSGIESSLFQDKINVDTITKQHQKHNNYFSKSQSNPRSPQDPIISLDFYKNMSISNRHLSFVYEYDFDENKVFYYLGTLGKMSPYRNPHELGQVKVFGSSNGKGLLADFVGRESVNLRTLNEENSFIGVDIGQERFLVPSCYSIKNRNSLSHVMLGWQLEASNDKTNYDIIDKKIFFCGNAQQNQGIEKERNLLKQPGCTSTWNINKKIKEKYSNGFRYFVLRQIDKNSSGGYNMAISEFELYGEAIGRSWIFC